MFDSFNNLFRTHRQPSSIFSSNADLQAFYNELQSMKLNELFSTQQFKNAHQALPGSIMIVGTGFGLSLLMTAFSQIIATMFLIAAALLLLSVITKQLEAGPAINLALLVASSAFLINILPFAAVLVACGLAAYKCYDILPLDIKKEFSDNSLRSALGFR